MNGSEALPPDELRSHFRVVAATVPVVAFRGMAGGMPILIGLYIAHRWGLGQLAAFTVAHAAIAIALMIGDWGAMRALPRNLASLKAEAAAEFLASSNAVRLLLVALMFVTIVVIGATGIVDADVWSYLALLFALCPLFIATTNAVSERVVIRDMAGIGTAVVAGVVVFALLGTCVVLSGLGPRWFVGAFVAAKIVEAAVIVRGRTWVLGVRARNVWPAAHALLPFSAQSIMAVIYSRAGVFTVERMTTNADLGVFSVAAALQSALLLIPTSLALVYFPGLTRMTLDRDHRAVRTALLRYAIAASGSLLFGVIVLALAARRLSIVLSFPRESAPFVVIFAAVGFLSIFSIMAGFLMQARGQERAVARLSLVTLSLSVVYQVVALALFGLWGIVAAIAAAEITTILVFGLAMRGRGTSDPENKWR